METVMECNNCGNEKAYAWRVRFDKHLGRLEECNQCGSVSPNDVSIADVYWKGAGFHPGILDKNNQPIFLESRQHKARIMKEQGIRESGDRHHGQIGSEFAHIKNTRPVHNDNVLKLKKMFGEHEARISRR